MSVKQFTVIYNRPVANTYLASMKFFEAKSIKDLRKYLHDEMYDYVFIFEGFIQSIGDKVFYTYALKNRIVIK